MILSTQQKKALESIQNLGWSPIKPFANMTSFTTSSTIQYDRFPYLYTKHIEEPSYTLFMKKHCIEKQIASTTVKIIFQAKNVDRKYLNELKLQQNISEEIRDNMLDLEKRLDGKWNKGYYIDSSSEFMVLITKDGEQGGIVYTCASLSGYITIVNISNCKYDDEYMKFLYMNEEDRMRLKIIGPDFEMIDDVNRMALMDYLWVFGINKDVGSMVECLSNDLNRKAY